ncbi:hypothetical protein LTR08_009146 [Meristemomyces frigidus]|nr:hypothetical protein LTR08_009146 [Meristemomyces frigidus]
MAPFGTQRSEFPMSSLEPGVASQMEEDAHAGTGAPAVEVSPRKGQMLLNYRVADIPTHGLAPLDLPQIFLTLQPMYLRVESYRVMRASGLSGPKFEKHSRYKGSLPNLHHLVEKLAPKKRFHRGRKSEFKDSTLCAKLRWSESKVGPLFDFDPQPPRKEDQNSFQRKFGADRLLVVDLPLLSKPPHGLARGGIEEGLNEMQSQTQCFLGRKWEHLLIQDKKRKKSAGDEDSSKPGAYQSLFFAVSGDGIETISISEVLEWFIPFSLNAQQPARKAFARLDLGASRTKPALTFDISQIAYNVPDKLATRTSHHDPFADPNLMDSGLDHSDANIVMNDGCNEISVDAMEIIRVGRGLPNMPSVVQARVFGAKGVWYRAPGEVNPNPTAKDIWIRIGKSQIKVKHILHQDAELCSLNVVNVSRPARPSVLYPGFVPILLDRGVPRAAILELAQDEIKLETEKLLSALHDTNALRSWVHTQKDLLQERARKDCILAIGGFPVSHEERITMTLEGGFHLQECLFVAEELLRSAEQKWNLEAKNFKIPLSQSTSLIGIADPLDCLEPDELHVNFSSPFDDEVSGQLWSLDGKAVLIARNPSMRKSDIRKWKVVNKPELRHLVDVVIFPAKGPRPGASMLSGGDYDGDTFVICWNASLVTPFRNAPAPWDLPPIEHFGISKDTVKLNEIEPVPNSMYERWTDERARAWIRRSVAARLKFNMLGIVTLTHGSYTYLENNIASVTAQRLVDLHDYLVDADKQGYDYTHEDWMDYKRQLKIPIHLPPPAHAMFTKHNETEPDGFDATKCKPNPDNVVDCVYFDVLLPEVKSALGKVKDVVKAAGGLDSDLTKPFMETLHSLKEDTVARKELMALKKKLESVRKLWAELMGKYANRGRKVADWHDCVDRCRIKYEGIQPDDTTNLSIVEWVRRFGNNPTTWDILKASALAKYHGNTGSRMMFSVAGDELCRLKAQANPNGTRTVVHKMYLSLKPRKPKVAVEVDHDSDAETEADESTYYDGESIMDGFSTTPTSMKRKSSTELPPIKRLRSEAPSSPLCEQDPEMYLFDRSGGGRPPLQTPPKWLKRE